MDPVKSLRDLCDSVISDPALRPDQPEPGMTHCNSAVYKICFPYGYDFYDKTTKDLMMANDIFAWLKSNWQQIDGDSANAVANKGSIAIAAQQGNPHGHVAVLYPGAMVYSSKWKKECPVLANVGERNAVMGANWAFAKEPFYFTDPKNTEVS